MRPTGGLECRGSRCSSVCPIIIVEHFIVMCSYAMWSVMMTGGKNEVTASKNKIYIFSNRLKNLWSDKDIKWTAYNVIQYESTEPQHEEEDWKDITNMPEIWNGFWKSKDNYITFLGMILYEWGSARGAGDCKNPSKLYFLDLNSKGLSMRGE